MLNTPFTATHHLLHIYIAMLGHQNQSCNRRQHLLIGLDILCHLWHPFIATTLWAVGTTKLHGFLQLSSWGMAVVEGTLLKHEFLPLPKDGHALFHHGMVPQGMFKIMYFMGGNPLHHNFEYGIFLLCTATQSITCKSMHILVLGLCLDCSFFNVLMYPFVGLQPPLSGHGHQPFLQSLQLPHLGWTSQLLHSALMQHGSENLPQHCLFIFDIQC